MCGEGSELKYKEENKIVQFREKNWILFELWIALNLVLKTERVNEGSFHQVDFINNKKENCNWVEIWRPR